LGVFDERIPKQEALARAMRILTKPLLTRTEVKARLVSVIGKEKEKISPIAFNGIPVVAIHGTHERRGKNMTNPIEALESGGFLVHLHCNGAVFEINGKKIAIQGMSGVPESYAIDVMKKWNPEPVKLIDCYNVLAVHQSIKGYVYSNEDNPVLTIEDFPNGFDLYVCGHVHVNQVVKRDNTHIIFPGSTVVTQQTVQEAGTKKGFYIFDFETRQAEFIPLKNQRELIYREVEVEGEDKNQIKNKVRNVVKETLTGSFSRKPLIRIKVKGNLGSRISFSDIEKAFSDKALLTIKADFRSAKLGERIQILREIQKKRMSIDELGFSILKEQLPNVTPEFLNEIFENLSASKNEETIQKLMEGIPQKGSPTTPEEGTTFNALEQLMKEALDETEYKKKVGESVYREEPKPKEKKHADMRGYV
jgi:DNA repair exonuclease SbcCD nuclease subunit